MKKRRSQEMREIRDRACIRFNNLEAVAFVGAAGGQRQGR